MAKIAPPRRPWTGWMCHSATKESRPDTPHRWSENAGKRIRVRVRSILGNTSGSGPGGFPASDLALR